MMMRLVQLLVLSPTVAAMNGNTGQGGGGGAFMASPRNPRVAAALVSPGGGDGLATGGQGARGVGGFDGGAAPVAAASVADRLVASSPLLEALGNAKTQRNGNSSRFGKFTTLHYGPGGGGVILGGKLTNLLLESSRVTSQPAGERNYHVFYQVLQMGGAARTEHGLASLETFKADECGCVIIRAPRCCCF